MVVHDREVTRPLEPDAAPDGRSAPASKRPDRPPHRRRRRDHGHRARGDRHPPGSAARRLDRARPLLRGLGARRRGAGMRVAAGLRAAPAPAAAGRWHRRAAAVGAVHRGARRRHRHHRPGGRDRPGHGLRLPRLPSGRGGRADGRAHPAAVHGGLGHGLRRGRRGGRRALREPGRRGARPAGGGRRGGADRCAGRGAALGGDPRPPADRPDRDPRPRRPARSGGSATTSRGGWPVCSTDAPGCASTGVPSASPCSAGSPAGRPTRCAWWR